jgi:NAD(P)-dependent dehydrogenase (short-subunit alcohol dehydrogenase family)
MAETSGTGGVAVITGGGTGIGAAAALRLAADGWTTVLAGRRAELLDRTVQQGHDLAGELDAVPSDVTAPTDVDALFAHAVDRYGRVDLLFNNAGSFGTPARIDEVDIEDWNAIVAVNLTSAFLCTRAAFGIMLRQRPQGGRIINNGSISAQSPRPNSVIYTATKHAITCLTRSTALDGRAFDIACGQIDIGNAATDMTEAMTTGVTQADGSVRAEPRMAVDGVADAVCYMAGLPLQANVLSLTVLATGMTFVGRG